MSLKKFKDIPFTCTCNSINGNTFVMYDAIHMLDDLSSILSYTLNIKWVYEKLYILYFNMFLNSIIISFISQFQSFTSEVWKRVYGFQDLFIYMYYTKQNNTKIMFKNTQYLCTILTTNVIQMEPHRVHSPILDNTVLATYISLQSKRISFNKIILHLVNKCTNRYLNMIFILCGRIPCEPVRPRKTVQTCVVGKPSMSSKKRVGLHTSMNPELGSYTIWVKT